MGHEMWFLEIQRCLDKFKNAASFSKVHKKVLLGIDILTRSLFHYSF